MLKRRKRKTSTVDGISVHPNHKPLSLKEKEHFTIHINKRKTKNFLKKNVFSGSILAVLVIVVLIIGHALNIKAQTATFYPSACLGGWNDSSKAEGQPQVTGEVKFSPDNSASLNNRVSQIYCGSFQGELPEDSDPKKIVLKFSWGVEKEIPPSPEKTIDPTDDFSHGDLNNDTTSPSSSSEEVTPTESPNSPEPVVTPEAEPTEEQSEPVSFFNSLFTRVLAEDALPEATSTTNTAAEISINNGAIFNVLYTLDGATWKTLGTVTQDEIGEKEFEIPADDIYDQEDLSHIQVNIQSQTILDQDLTVYLDGMWLEVQYEKLDADAWIAGMGSSIEAFGDQKKTFRADETPEFKVNLDSIQSATSSLENKNEKAATTTALQKDGSILKKAFSLLFKKKALAQSVSDAISKIDVLDAGGKDTNLKTDITDDNENATIKVERPQGSLKPGKYVVRMKVETPDGPVMTEDEFMWGVLAINTDRSVYLAGDSAHLQMASLSESGHTLCDSNLTLRISDPAGNTETFKTKNGGISQNDTCGPDNVTDEPDYSANFLTTTAGAYSMTLTNEDTGNEIDDSFYVEPKLTYNIQRIGATRINPFKSDYKMTLKITANTAFNGDVNEYFPSTFAISDISDGGEVNAVSDNGMISKRISWNLHIEKGQSVILTYTYHAPEESPAIFHLGQAEIISHASSTAPQKVFAERRMWQLASDATCTFNGTGSVTYSTRTWSGCTGGGAPQSGDTISILTNQILVYDMSLPVTVAAVTIASPTAANGLTINTTRTLNITGALTFNQIAAGVANAQTVTLAGTGNLNVGSIVTSASLGTGTSKVTCSSLSTGTLAVSGNIALVGSGVTSSTGSTIDFGTSSTACNVTAGSVTLTGGTVSKGLLKMGTGNLTLNGNVTFTGTAANAVIQTATTGAKITLNNSTIGTGGTLTLVSVTDLDSSGTSAVSYATAVTTWGTIHVTGGTLTMSAAAQTATGVDIDSGATLAKGSTLLTDSGNMSCDGTLSGSGGVTLATSISPSLTGTCSVTNNGTFTIATSTTGSFASGSNYTIAGSLSITAGKTITNNGTVSLTSSTPIASVAGTFLNNTNATLNLSGTIGANAILDADASPNTVTYKAAATIKVPSGTGGHYNNLNIDSGLSTVTSAAVIVDNTLTIATGVFSLANASLTVTGATDIFGTLSNVTGATAKTFNGLVTVKSGGVVNLTVSTNPALNFNGGITVDSGAAGVNFGTGSTHFTASQSLSGPVSMTLGAAILDTGVTLTNANTATVNMSSLTLSIATSTVAMSLSNNSTTNVSGAITFTANTQINNQSILMNGDADLSTATLTVNTPTAAGSSLITCVSSCSGTFHATGAVALNGNDTSTGVVTMNMDTATTLIDGLLTIDGGAASATTVSIGSGNLDLGAGITFSGTPGNAKLNTTVANTIELTGTWTGAGTLTGVNSSTTLKTVGAVSLGGAITWPAKVNVFSGTTSLGAVAITFSGAVDVSGTLANLSSATAKTFNGLLTIKSGGIVALTTVTNPALNFGAGITADSGAGSINFGTGATVFTANQTFSGPSDMRFGGTFTVNNGVTLTNNNTGTTTSSGAITVTTPTGTIVNNGTISASSTLADNGVVTNNGTFNIVGNLSGSGSWTQGNGSTLNLGGTTSSANTVTTFSASTASNTVNYSGQAQTAKDPTGGTAHTYYNLILSGGGTKTLTSITSVANDFSMSGTSTATSVFTTIGNDVNITGTAIWTNGAGNTVTGDLTVGNGATLTMGNFILSIGGATSNTGTINTVTASHNTIKTFTGLVTIQTGGAWDLSVGNPATVFKSGLNRIGTGTFTSGSGSYTFNTNAQTLTGDNTFTITNASSSVTTSTGLTLSGANPTITNLTNTANAILTFSGTVPTITTLTATANPNTVQYTSTSDQTIKGTTYHNLIKSGVGGTANLGGNLTINGNLTLSSGDLSASDGLGGANNMNIKGNWTNVAGRFLADAGLVTFSGTTQQTLSGDMLSRPFNDLTFSNSSGSNASDNERTGFVASVRFVNDAAVSGVFTITTPSTRVEYLSGGTYNFTDINWNGGATTTRIFFRNSATSGTWNLNVSGTQIAVSSVNVSRSDASGGSLIDASDGTNFDANNNTNWNLASISCSTNIASTAFGALDISSVKIASPNATTTMTCTGATGCSLYMHDQGSGASPGLYESASSSLILSATAALSAGTNGYGAQAATSSAGSGNVLTLNLAYLKTGNNVGGFTTANSTVASSSGSITGREVVVTHKAAIAGTTLPGSYADTITYSCTAN